MKPELSIFPLKDGNIYSFIIDKKDGIQAFEYTKKTKINLSFRIYQPLSSVWSRYLMI